MTTQKIKRSIYRISKKLNFGNGVFKKPLIDLAGMPYYKGKLV